MIKIEEDTPCDICDLIATKVLCEQTSEWCANWFIGYYCDKCYAEVEAAMKANVIRDRTPP